jgi:drug/metabolite transporter (DMT)-like permease
MAAVLGGLGAALIWSVGTAFASQAARALGPRLTLAWVMLIGLLALALVLPWSGTAHLSLASLLWLALGGIGNIGGLLILYHALRIGQMGVVMPIVSTEGGIAAVLAIIAGQPVTGIAGTALAATLLGVIMTAVARRPPPDLDLPELPGAPAQRSEGIGGTAAVRAPRGHTDRRAAVWSVLGALSMGVSLFATGRAGAVLPAAWAVLPPRLIGVLAITLPLALRRKLRITTGTAHLLLIAGLCELGGFFAFAAGSRHGLAQAAVLATLTGAISVGFGRLLFGERLRATQLAGVVIIFAGVATLTAVTTS